jgi:hypothetical protein
MLGYRGLRDAGLSRQGPDRFVSVATQPLEDGPSRRIGDGFTSTYMPSRSVTL